MKIKKNFFNTAMSVTLVLSILSSSILLSSCSKEASVTPITEDNQSQVQEKYWWVAVAVAAAIKIVSDLSEGQSSVEVEYYLDGSIKSKKTSCSGVGSCVMPSVVANSGDNVTNDDGIIYIYENADYQVNAELIRTKEGDILYAINHDMYPRNAARFFYDKTVEISSGLLINNTKVLEMLKLSRPITIQGKYEVHNSPKYTFIKINK